MDKHKENEILLVHQKVLKFDNEEVDILKKEVELYNDIYKEISEIQSFVLPSHKTPSFKITFPVFCHPLR